MNNKVTIDMEYLKEIMDFEARKTVGKIMKRFEILEEADLLKSEVKELIYESYRDTLDLIDAHTKGLNITQFNFTKPRED